MTNVSLFFSNSFQCLLTHPISYLVDIHRLQLVCLDNDLTVIIYVIEVTQNVIFQKK